MIYRKSRIHPVGLLILLIGFVGFLLSGCMSPAGPIDRQRICPSPPVVLEKATARQSLQITLQALADMEISAYGKKYPLRVALLMKNPDGLRMESIPLIGPPDFMLSTQGDRLQVFLPGKGEFYTGRASKHLSRFVPVPIPVGDMVALLTGNYPPLRHGDCFSPVSSTGNLRQIDVRDSHGDVRQSLWIQWPEQKLMKLQVVGGAEGTDYTAVFSDHTSVNQLDIPQKITIRSGGAVGMQKTITVRYTDVEMVEATTSSPLELLVPPGVKPIELRDEY